MRLLLEHLRALRATLRHLLRSPHALLIHATIIGIALSLPSSGYVLLKNLKLLGERLAGPPQITLFLHTWTSTHERERLGEWLRQHAGIHRIEFVPRDVALKRLQQSTGFADLIGGLTQNPLPDAFVVYPEKRDAESLETLRDELKAWPSVEYAQLDSAWTHKLEALLNVGRTAVILLAILLGFALVAITFNTIRLQILTRREEIEISKLIGATDAFIRRPFLYFGLMQGLLGGAVAWLLVSATLLLLNQTLTDFTALYASDFRLHGLSLTDGLTLLGFSGYLGWLGAGFSVSQHLWRIEVR